MLGRMHEMRVEDPLVSLSIWEFLLRYSLEGYWAIGYEVEPLSLEV
jgi:hypothetical protein